MLGTENKENYVDSNQIVYDKSRSVIITPINNHTIEKKLLTNDDLDSPQYRNSKRITILKKPKPLEIEEPNSIE